MRGYDIFDFFDFATTSFSHGNINTATVENKDDRSVISLDLPGYKKSDIKITSTKNNLIIKVDGDRGKKSYIYTLKDLADYKNITSRYEDGVLKISVPYIKKSEDVIEVKVE